MQENGKRLLSLLMVVAMLFSMMPMSVGAQEQEEEQVMIEALQSDATEPEETLPVVTEPQTAEPEETQPQEVALPATKNQTKEGYPVLEFGVELDVEITQEISAQNRYAWVEFTPETDGVYAFTVAADFAVGCAIIDWNAEYLQHNYAEAYQQVFQKMLGGKTYKLGLFTSDGSWGTAQVTASYSPLESITFEPVTFVEGTCGHIAAGWNEQTQKNDLLYYYYPLRLSYTATFTDGTVVKGSESRIHYNGNEYGISYETNQDYENQWVAGNTYAVQATVMGHAVEVPVTIVDAGVQSVTIDPIKVVAGTCGYMTNAWNPDTGNYDLEYFHYGIDDIMQKAEYAVTYDSGYVEYGSGSMVYRDDEWFSFATFSNQDYENQWTVGNTYYIDAFLFGQQVQVPVTIIDTPLQSIEFQPITVMEGTCGGISTSWNPETEKSDLAYYQYYAWDLFYKTSYTATFIDGSQISGSNDSFYYDGTWYSMSCYTDQSYNNQWTAGNTYVLKVEVMGQETEVPVTITPAPLQSIEFQPITIMEGTCGSISTGWNPETGSYDLEYYYYHEWDVLGKTQYTATFADGTTQTNSGDNSLYYEGQWHYASRYTDQSYENQWTVGNTYYIDVYLLGQHTQVPVTIVPSPVASVTAQPVTMYEGAGGSQNSYWPGDGNEYFYYTYYWWKKLTYTVTFTDGTSATVYNGNSLYYDGEYYSISTSDSQGYKDQWTVGNTYTATVSLMGVSTEVSVTIEPSPVESVVFDPITLEEHTGGYWYWGESGEYYRYYWTDKVTYTVTFRDGTVKHGTYWSKVEYDGTYYGISTYEDPQSGDTPWLVDNTYGVQVQFEGKWYDAYVTIAKTTEDNGFTYLVQGGKVVINGCTMQTEILQIPESIDGYPVVGITSLGDALAYAEELRIPDCVTMLSAGVFDPYGFMIPLKKLVLGSGITTLTADMLRSARELEQIVVAAGNPSLCSIDGVVYSKDVTTLIAYPAAKQELHKIPDSVTNVSALFAGNGYSNANVKFGAGVQEYKLVGGIIYNEDMTQVIKATSAATGSYVMPETVTEIAPHAFTGSDLTSIAVSPSVTYLSYTSFYQAINLEEISIPTSVSAISGFEISGCVGLKKVNISDLSAWCNVEGGGGLLYYAHDLYLNGEKIVDLVIPETVTEGVYNTDSIAYEAFAYGSFESVTIPSRIQYIDWNAFADCENLKKVNISDLSAWCGIQFENDRANPLYYARDLYLNGEKVTDLVLPETVTGNVYVADAVYGIGNYAFYNANIESLTVPSYVYGIGQQAFYGSSVEKIVFEEGITSIGYAAFQNSAVKALELPDSLSYMEGWTFAGCKALEQLTIGGGLTVIPSGAFRNTALRSVTFPKQVQYIGGNAFESAQLTEVSFLCDEVQIGWSAFKNCPLGDLKLGNNVTYMDWEAFNGISATQIQHPSSVTEISYRVYALNPNLVSVTIPETVQHIDTSAFEGDSNLSHVLYTGTQEQWEQLDTYSNELNKATIHYEATGNEVTTEQNCTTIRLFCTICDQWETVQKKNAAHSFADGVCTVCGYEGFWEYEVADGTVIITGYLGSDTDVTIPVTLDGFTVTGFETDVFSYNRKLTSVVLPDSITQIPVGAFRCCSALESVTLGKSVTVIGEEAFLENYSLETINLSNSLTTIGDAAFCRCVDLVVTIPDSVHTIGAMAFYACSQLEQVEIPAGVTEISYEAFAACWNLEKVTIPDTVTTIGYYAFSGASIQELTVPASVQTICSNAFYMNNMETVVFLGDMPQMENAFDYSGITFFYTASNKSWKDMQTDSNRWRACKAPTITQQPQNQTVQPGETVTLSAAAYGQRLSYQWYYAAPGAKTFTPVGGDRIELTVTVDQDTSGARAYCVVTDLLGQTAKTDTVTLKNPTKSTGIRLNQLPYTLEYDLRQELRTRGLEVVLTFDDNTEESVLDYTVSGYDPNVGGVQTITVTYGSYTATFEVTVNEEKLSFANTEQKIELSAPEGAVEQDVELVVETVDPEQELPDLPELPEILQENEAVIFDITLEKDGEEVQPTQTVQVSIPVPEHMESKRCKVYHIDDNGTATDMNAAYKDGRMVFDTDHFSYYAVVESSGVTVSGAVIGNSNVIGTVVRLISGGEVLESMSVSQNGTYVFENVGSNDYVIQVAQEGMSTISETVTVADQDVYKDIVCYYVTVAANGQQTQYSTLAQAVKNAPAGSTVQLLGSLADNVTVTKELVLDLNGFDLTGDVTVASGTVLKVKDSQTDDHTVMDEAGYGKLIGTVTGMQVSDGYMMITEGSGVSFHRIDLTLTDMTLRSSEVGVYYKSNFAGDELVAQNVSRYGVALSIQGAPTANALGILSWFDDFEAGSNAANGTLLHGIMKLTNSEADNAYNAELPVYGRAYILTKDGQYVFGESVSRSLRQQVELIDGQWSTLTAEQQTGVLEMYESYRSAMENWNISNIKSNSEK